MGTFLMNWLLSDDKLNPLMLPAGTFSHLPHISAHAEAGACCVCWMYVKNALLTYMYVEPPELTTCSLSGPALIVPLRSPERSMLRSSVTAWPLKVPLPMMWTL